jgi:hypothetical protein
LRRGESELKGADHVVERDPAHALAAVADLAAEAQLEGGEHLLQRATFGAQDDADACVDDTDAGVARRLAGRFPFLAHLCEKIIARRRCFGEQFIAPTAVVANRRGAHERARAIRRGGDGFADEARALDAAVADFAFERLGPAAAGDVLAGEVHDGVDAVEAGGVDLAGFGVPE